MTSFEEQCDMTMEESRLEDKCAALNFYMEIEADVGVGDLNIDVEGIEEPFFARCSEASKLTLFI
jgi:hypothetical protein